MVFFKQRVMFHNKDMSKRLSEHREKSYYLCGWEKKGKECSRTDGTNTDTEL